MNLAQAVWFVGIGLTAASLVGIGVIRVWVFAKSLLS